MRCACIDLGSNTTRLLVAEGDGGRLRPVASAREYTRLGADRGPGGELHPSRIAATVAAVREQLARARAAGAERVRVVGTAAIRLSPAPEELCGAVEAGCDARVEVLDGEEEARLAFRGATCLDGAHGEEVAVVDVGGGSTELTCGPVGGDPAWVASVPLGSASLTDRFLPDDPPGRDELRALGEHVRAALRGVSPPAARRGLAVGGSAVALGIGAGPTSSASLVAAASAAASRPSADFAADAGLHPARARVLPAGLLLLAGAAEALQVPLEVARGGLREGVVLELLAQGS